jgi:hypothetical protein
MEDLPAHATEPEDFAEQNCTLKRKLRHAVTVANSCAKALEKEKKEKSEAGEKIRQLNWALLLERAAHQRRKDNPLQHNLGPSPADVQWRLDMERERNIKLEHRRQADIETGLRMKLAQQIEREKEEQRRAEGAAAALARKMRPKTQKEIDQMRALWSAAKALAVSQGRKEASFADLRECRGVPRLVSSKRKD